MNRKRPVRGQAGSSALEFAIAAPVVLMLGLGALQWALVFHARQAIEHAAIEAARAGSVGHALPGPIGTGLARGLLPYWSVHPEIRSAGADREAAVAAARARLEQAQSAGWIRVRRLSPTRESFADWAEPALDGWGRPQAGTLEIPNDGLMHAEHRAPKGGAGALHLGLPVGRSSGQTLLDANLLKIEVVYGVPMTVPLVGRLAAAAGRLVGGCLSTERGGCAMHEAADAAGRRVPRWPVVTSATVRMQSPARETTDTPSRASLSRGIGAGARAWPARAVSGQVGGSAVLGSAAAVPARDPGRPAASVPGELVHAGVGEIAAVQATAGQALPVQTAAVQAATVQAERAAERGGGAPPGSSREPGWLSFGGDRLFTVPGACAGG